MHSNNVCRRLHKLSSAIINIFPENIFQEKPLLEKCPQSSLLDHYRNEGVKRKWLNKRLIETNKHLLNVALHFYYKVHRSQNYINHHTL